MDNLEMLGSFMNDPESIGAKIVPIIYDLIDECSEEERNSIMKMFCDRIYSDTYDNNKVRAFFDGYEQHKDIKMLNLQLVSIIGIMKSYISKIDENNNNTCNACDNMAAFGSMIKAISIPMRNYDRMIDEFKSKWGDKKE